MSILPIEDTIVMKSGLEVRLRRARVEDIPIVTTIVCSSFRYWTNRGVSLSPARQTDEITQSYIDQEVVIASAVRFGDFATICVSSAKIEALRGFVDVHEHGRPAIQYSASPALIESGEYLMVKRFVVSHSNSGVGSAIFAWVKECARECGLKGLVLETAREADWLFRSLEGFHVAGMKKYDRSEYETQLMINTFTNH